MAPYRGGDRPEEAFEVAVYWGRGEYGDSYYFRSEIDALLKARELFDQGFGSRGKGQVCIITHTPRIYQSEYFR
jgi:hypothetical protein